MTAEQLAAIHAACFTQSRSWSVSEFEKFLASAQCGLTTSEHGFAVLRKSGSEVEILTIAVHPDARRQGEGRNLLNAALALAKSQDCKEVFLEVMDTNAAAIALYESANFSQAGFRKDYYQSPGGIRSSAIVMHKFL